MTRRPSDDPARLLDATDRSVLVERGLTMEEARRQLALLTGPPRHADLVRPCVVDDGIDRLSDHEACLLRHDVASAAGRLGAMVPASGAATRMFRGLLAARASGVAGTREDLVADGSREARETLQVLDALDRFAFRDALDAILAARGADLAGMLGRGETGPVLDALLDDHGLGYASLPKGLLLFHGGPHGPRTAFEEHLVEAASVLKASDGSCRLHFTVSPEHRAGFVSRLASVRDAYEARLAARFDVGFSTQSPSTDTLAVDDAGRPVRSQDGRPLLRPGGHGALLANLDDLGGDIVFLKNIDNVAPDHRKAAGVRWARLIIGHLVGLLEAGQALARRLDDPSDGAAVDDARVFARDALHLDPSAEPGEGDDARRAFWAQRLDRPLRVCGMVVNTGEPGGGPFWVRDRHGRVGLQIVESAEVAAEQREILAASTHFNPVFMVCALRDRRGRPHDLSRYVDESAAIVTRKSVAGRDIDVLERPGLWNGAMAHWNTVFVEVPEEVFTPVKTITDLLRPEHQTPDR